MLTTGDGVASRAKVAVGASERRCTGQSGDLHLSDQPGGYRLTDQQLVL